MRIFVTGATGFVGSHLVNWLKRNHEVYAGVHHLLPYQWTKDALEGTHVVACNVTDFPMLLEDFVHYKPDAIVHLAALSIVKGADRDPLGFARVNVGGTVAVLEAARRAQIPRVIVQSTDKVFGERMQADINDPLSPTETYSASKIAAEMFARVADPPVVICRMSNIYGLDYNDRIIPNTIRACLRGQSPVIYHNLVSTRQYLHVDDAVAAIRLLCELEKPPPVVQIAALQAHSQEAAVLEVLKHFPELQPDRLMAPNRREIGNQSMKHTLEGWYPSTSLPHGIERTIEAFKKYREDWE